MLATTGNTSAVSGYTREKYTKIQVPRFQRNYIIARDQKSDLHGTSFQSSPKINRTRLIFAYNESLQHPTIAGLLIKILLFLVFDRYSAHLFQSNSVKSDRIRGPTCSGKVLNFIFPMLSSQNVRGLGHPTILIPSFHGLH